MGYLADKPCSWFSSSSPSAFQDVFYVMMIFVFNENVIVFGGLSLIFKLYLNYNKETKIRQWKCFLNKYKYFILFLYNKKNEADIDEMFTIIL